METRERLLNWTGSATDAERLAAQLLAAEAFLSVDPMHPLGGPDDLQDIICVKNGKRWVAAAWFPRGEKLFTEVKRKFKEDLAGARGKEGVEGFVFICNQHLTMSERKELTKLAAGVELDLLHLERIRTLLDTPPNYGLRLEYLDLEMTRDEQVAFFAAYTRDARAIQANLSRLLALLETPTLVNAMPAHELQEFAKTVYSLAGYPGALSLFTPMERLRPPLAELERFEAKVRDLTGGTGLIVSDAYTPVGRLHPPLRELEEYEQRLERLVGSVGGISIGVGAVDRLKPPLEELKEFERVLDSVLAKAARLRNLKPAVKGRRR